MKYSLSILLAFIIVNHSYPADTPEFSIETSISRTTVTAIAVHLGTEIGRNWAVGVTSKVINKTIKNPSPFFDWTIGRAIEGKELLEFLPIAEKSGARVGALTAAICTPLVFDFTLLSLSSWKKVGQFLNDKYIEDKKVIKQPSRKDFLMVGSNIAILGVMGYLIKDLKL